jgi:hypothetical protein
VGQVCPAGSRLLIADVSNSEQHRRCRRWRGSRCRRHCGHDGGAGSRAPLVGVPHAPADPHHPDAVGGSPEHRLPAEVVLATVAHLGYGASCGVLFALLTRRRRMVGPPRGVGYGLLLWLAGYGVWVPAIGAVPPPQRDQPGRQLALVAGHLVYGVVLAEGLRRLRDVRRARQAATPAAGAAATTSGRSRAAGSPSPKSYPPRSSDRPGSY